MPHVRAKALVRSDSLVPQNLTIQDIQYLALRWVLLSHSIGISQIVAVDRSN